MIGGLFKKSKQKVILSIDFGGESTKALLCKKEKEKTSILGYSVQFFEDFGIFDISGFEQDNAKKIISKTLEQIKEQCNKKIEEVCIRLPADILKAQIFSESYKRETPEKKISKKEQAEICWSALKEVKKDISKNYALKTGIMPEDIYFPTVRIFETKIDGYKTPLLEGFSGEMVEFKILATFLPKSYFENIKRIFHQLKLRNLKFFHTAELVSKIVDRFGGNCIFLDIGGDTTQIILFKDGRLEKIDEMTIGGRIVSKLISRLFGISEKEARLLKERYSNKALSEDTRARMKDVVSLTLQNWFCNLKLKLSQFKTFLPSDIFLFGGGSRLLGTEEILTEGDWTVNPLSERDDFLKFCNPLVSNPRVKFINPVEIKNINNIPESLNNVQFVIVFLQTI
jgi:cell division ATPase FtsA